MPAEDCESICEECRKIDFQDLVHNARPDSRAFAWREEKSPYTLHYTKGCAVCEVLVQHFPEDSSTVQQEVELRSYSVSGNSRWAQDEDPDISDAAILTYGVPQTWEFESLHPERLFCQKVENDAQNPSHSSPLQESWNPIKARLWLRTCLRYHYSSCGQEALDIPGMNLLDCEEMIVVKADKTSRWLALSYVWGSTHQTIGELDQRSFRSGSRLPSDMGATVRDAISVTKKLRYRFLWVDEYCIDQRDESHRNAQINLMNRIYQGADITIVAAAGKDKTHGLPGVRSTKRKYGKTITTDNVSIFSGGPDPDKEAQRSTWFTRAW